MDADCVSCEVGTDVFSGLSSWVFSFCSGSVLVRFVADKVTLVQVFLRVLPVLPISMIPQMPRSHLISVFLSEGQAGEALEHRNKGSLFFNIGVHCIENTFCVVYKIALRPTIIHLYKYIRNMCHLQGLYWKLCFCNGVTLWSTLMWLVVKNKHMLYD